MKIFRQIILLVALTGFWFASSPAIIAADSTPAITANTFPLTLTDGAGRTVKIAAVPRRIISLSPAATDILIKVGTNTELVGVTRYCDNPALVESRVKRLGGVLDPDYEGMVALKPDLVVMPLLTDKSMQNKLTALGLPLVVLHPEGLAGVMEDIQMLGRATGNNKKGEDTIQLMKWDEDFLKQAIKDVPPDKYPRVLIRMGDVCPAPGSYVDDLLTMAGGRNVLPKGPKAWVTVTPEAMLQLHPDLILDFTPPDPSKDSYDRDPKIPESLQVITIPNDKAIYRPGPDLVGAMGTIEKQIYHDRFINEQIQQPPGYHLSN